MVSAPKDFFIRNLLDTLFYQPTFSDIEVFLRTRLCFKKRLIFPSAEWGQISGNTIPSLKQTDHVIGLEQKWYDRTPQRAAAVDTFLTRLQW